MRTGIFRTTLAALQCALLAAALTACDNDPSGRAGVDRSQDYRVTTISSPDKQRLLLDLGHHFHIDIVASGKPVSVTLPINPARLRNVDIDTLLLVRHGNTSRTVPVAAGPVRWSRSGSATVELSEPGNYSLVAAPADALSRSLLRAFCGNRQVPRLCEQIDCAAQQSGTLPDATPGVAPCDFCTRMQPGFPFAECLLDLRDVLYPERVQSVPGDDTDGPVCEYRKVFDESFCSYRPQADDEQACMDLAGEFGETWSEDLTGQPCVCGTRVRSAQWDPAPNGCTDAIENRPSCIGWNWNCVVVSD